MIDFFSQKGSIEVICGGMFSGKTEELLRRIRNAQYAKLKLTVFKPRLDDRYSINEVVSHNGLATMARPVESSLHILNQIEVGTDLVAIDEAQFFDEELPEVVTHLADRDYRVVIAGLDQDFRGEPFGVMPHLMALAEHITKLHAVCTVCGRPASRTQRLINGEPAGKDDPVILVGASEAYEARCRQHHDVPDGKGKGLAALPEEETL